jgi:prophage regulatory protein
MRPDDLVGFTEVVELLGVPRRTAARYVKRPDFPEPYVRLAAGPIWLRADVQRWTKAHLPLPVGRPPDGMSERRI